MLLSISIQVSRKARVTSASFLEANKKNQAGNAGLKNYQNNQMLGFSKVIKNKSDEEGFEPPTF